MPVRSATWPTRILHPPIEPIPHILAVSSDYIAESTSGESGAFRCVTKVVERRAAVEVVEVLARTVPGFHLGKGTASRFS